jgi:hypothetical protein
MWDAAMESNAPMMHGGLLPAKLVLLFMNREASLGEDFGIYVEEISPGTFRCASAAHLMHNEVIRLMQISAETLRQRIDAGDLTPQERTCADILEANAWMSPALPQNRIMPVFTVEAGKPACIEDVHGAHMAAFVSAACEFMAMPIAGKTPGALPRAARRRLERKGKTVAITNVTVSRSVTAGLNRPHQAGEHGKALHFVSGHWRISPTSLHGQMVHGQWKIWIEGHWRGDPEYGVVLHRYLARKRNKQPEGIAA